jgi:hypothetical protein
LFRQSLEQWPISGTVISRDESMHHRNGHVGTTQMIAKIGNERLAPSCRRTGTSRWPHEPRRQPDRHSGDSKQRQRRG